jgi:WD40 repeat protein
MEKGWSPCLQTIECGGNSDTVRAVTWLTDSRLVFVKNKTIEIWDSVTSQCMVILKGHTGLILSIASSADGLLASGSEDKTVRIWDNTAN